MRSLAVGSIAMVLLVSACGGTDRSAEEVVAGWLEAIRNGNAEEVRKAFPSREEVERLWSCPPDVDLAARFEAPSAEAAGWRQRAVVLVATSRVASEALKPGDEVGGCVAREAMTLSRMDTTVSLGGTERVLRMRLVGFDGRYRILGY